MTKVKWSDDQVLEWGKIYIESKISLMNMERDLGISHSTLWWCFVNRLPNIDYCLSQKVNFKLTGGTQDQPLH